MSVSNTSESLYKCILSLKPSILVGRSLDDPLSVYGVSTSEGEWYVQKSGEGKLHRISEFIYERYKGKGVSDSDIADIQNKMLGKLAFNPEGATLDYLCERLRDLDNDIRKREHCLSIFGLNLEEGLVFQLGKVEFHARSLEKLAPSESGEPVSRIYSWGCLTEEGSQLYMQDIDRSVISDHVFALEFLFNLLENEHPEDAPVSFSLDWFDRSDTENITLDRIKGSHSFSKSASRSSWDISNISLGKSEIEKWKETVVFQKLDRLLKGDGRIERRVVRALSFLHDALDDRSRYRILKCVIGLDSLLGSKNGNSRALAEKVAFLLETDVERRMKLVKEFMEIYDLRSDIGHGGHGRKKNKELDPDKEYYYVWSMESYAIQILIGSINAFLKLYDEDSGFRDEEGINRWYQLKKMT